MSCNAKLASDHRGRWCSACDESGRGLRDDQQVVDFALELYPLRRILGVVGLDYIFFHRYFDALQDELAELRRKLYRQPEPPRPMALAAAAAWATETESKDTRLVELPPSPIDKLMSGTSLAIGTDRLLLRGFEEPTWPRTLQQHTATVSSRLRELEDELPAAIGTLHLALICGTTPLPPGIRASSELRAVPRVGVVSTYVLNVFSAKERDVRVAYEALLGGTLTYARNDVAPLTSRWRTRGPLPVLEIVCIPYQGRVPTPAAVQRFFRQARTPVANFFDGAIKARDYGYTLRAWTMLVLIEKRKMDHQEALAFWNERAGGLLPYPFRAGVRETQTGESVLSQELRRLRQRVKRWQRS